MREHQDFGQCYHEVYVSVSGRCAGHSAAFRICSSMPNRWGTILRR